MINLARRFLHRHATDLLVVALLLLVLFGK
jgi:hypothetical protein